MLAKNIIKFCKKHVIPFYILNDVKIAKQLNAHGIYISANNKKISLSLFSGIKFELIGSAHNQFEYFIKQKQNCKTIMLSPIFYNNKYSLNQILNPIKFNLISLNWRTEICALGGISDENINRVRQLNTLAEQRGQNLAQMALAWILKDPRISSVLIGVSKPGQVLDSIRCLENYSFTSEELKNINDILK